MRRVATFRAAAALVAAVGFAGSAVKAGDLVPDDTALFTEFSKQFGPAGLAKTDIAGPGVAYDFTGPSGTGTGVGDDFPVAAATGCEADAGGAFGDCTGFDGIAYIITNLSTTEAVNVSAYMNTGFTDATPGGVLHEDWCGSAACDTFYQGPWVEIGPAETKRIRIDFSAPDDAFEDADDPDFAEPVVAAEVIRLNQTSHMGIQVAYFGTEEDAVHATLLINQMTIQKEITSGPIHPTGEFEEVVDGVANGSFEDDACGSPFDTLAGPGGVTGWTVEVNQVDHICGYHQSQDGSNDINMIGTADEGAMLNQMSQQRRARTTESSFGWPVRSAWNTKMKPWMRPMIHVTALW